MCRLLCSLTDILEKQFGICNVITTTRKICTRRSHKLEIQDMGYGGIQLLGNDGNGADFT